MKLEKLTEKEQAAVIAATQGLSKPSQVYRVLERLEKEGTLRTTRPKLPPKPDVEGMSWQKAARKLDARSSHIAAIKEKAKRERIELAKEIHGLLPQTDEPSSKPRLTWSQLEAKEERERLARVRAANSRKNIPLI